MFSIPRGILVGCADLRFPYQAQLRTVENSRGVRGIGATARNFLRDHDQSTSQHILSYEGD
jgi:hypothetical protein